MFVVRILIMDGGTGGDSCNRCPCPSLPEYFSPEMDCRNEFGKGRMKGRHVSRAWEFPQFPVAVLPKNLEEKKFCIYFNIILSSWMTLDSLFLSIRSNLLSIYDLDEAFKREECVSKPQMFPLSLQSLHYFYMPSLMHGI